MTHALSQDDTSPAADRTEAHAIDCARRLRLVLRANAASSAISGGMMAASPGSVDQILGTGQPDAVRLVGVALLPFAAFVAWLSTASLERLRVYTPGIVVGDVGWVVASVVTIALGWYSSTGVAGVVAAALLVDVFAVLQFNGVRHLRRA